MRVNISRRGFLARTALWAGVQQQPQTVMTVRGPVPASSLGVFLPHEHLFSNFGEPPAEPPVYDERALLDAVLPYLRSILKLGCGAIADATAAYFGRHPRLLRWISEKTGLHILTNTGYYGAAKDQYVPAHAFQESASRLAERWVAEWHNGIGETGVKPGFIKIGVDAGALSEIDRKLVAAAARVHRQSGLTIAVHTGGNVQAARQQLEILRAEGVAASAWIWVHAHQTKDEAALREAAEAGAWISLDGLDTDSMERHLHLVRLMKSWSKLNQVLLSHDGNSFRAGGKRPMRPYSALWEEFIPRLQRAGFAEGEIRQMTVENPARAFAIQRRLT